MLKAFALGSALKTQEHKTNKVPPQRLTAPYDCPPLYFPEGTATRSCEGVRECHISCEQGFYGAYGDANLVCMENGEWSGAPLVCASEQQYPADVVDNIKTANVQQQQQQQQQQGVAAMPKSCGNLHFDESVFPQTCYEADGFCKMQCAEGYTYVEGNHEISCLSHLGEWSGSPLFCSKTGALKQQQFPVVAALFEENINQPIKQTKPQRLTAPYDCPPLYFPEGTATRSCEGVRECHISCEAGFDAVYGDATLFCQENGKWSGPALVCAAPVIEGGPIAKLREANFGMLVEQKTDQFPIAARMIERRGNKPQFGRLVGRNEQKPQLPIMNAIGARVAEREMWDAQGRGEEEEEAAYLVSRYPNAARLTGRGRAFRI